MQRRLTRILLVALAVAALAAAGIALNLVLLGYADSRNDPIGKLTPRTGVIEPIGSVASPTTTDERSEPDEEPDD